MKNIIILFFSIIISSLLYSCNSTDKEISLPEFINNVLPSTQITDVEVKNRKQLSIKTNTEINYKVKTESSQTTNELINKITQRNKKVNITHIFESKADFSLFNLIPFALPLLMFIHFILLWIALRKIIKSKIETTEKLVFTIIVLLFPLFGSVIFLTTKTN